jgi:hypothetical protein
MHPKKFIFSLFQNHRHRKKKKNKKTGTEKNRPEVAKIKIAHILDKQSQGR